VTEVLFKIAGAGKGDPKLRPFLWRIFFAEFKEAGGSVIDLAHSLIEIGLAGSVDKTKNAIGRRCVDPASRSLRLQGAPLSAYFAGSNISQKPWPLKVLAPGAVSKILMDI
jgi:hypothetical protein